MGNRRMFSNRITKSARFLKMPPSTQLLYFHLGMSADDDGVAEAFCVMREVGSNEDDLRILAAKGFVKILNEDLITYIMDWNENNLIRPDRKKDSIYQNLLISIVPDVNILEKKTRSDLKNKGVPLITENENCPSMDGPRTDNGRLKISKDKISKINKKEKEKEKSADVNVCPPSKDAEIIGLYNCICKSLPKVKQLTANRKAALKVRLKTYNIGDFKELFILAENSDFLKGHNDRNWVANFDWLIREANMVKVLEGNYNNRAKGKKNNALEREIDFDAYEKEILSN